MILANGPIVALLHALHCDVSAIIQLASIHRALWQLEDAVRRPATNDREARRMKQCIDQLNQRRHDTIDGINGSLELPPVRNAGPYFSETLGELIDRLLILELKLEAAEEKIWNPSLEHNLAVERTERLQQWYDYLVAYLHRQAEALQDGCGTLPPRAEWKLYNEGSYERKGSSEGGTDERLCQK